MRNHYQVRSYDGKIIRDYKNYKSARNFASKLCWKDIDCGIYQWFDDEMAWVIICGC